MKKLVIILAAAMATMAFSATAFAATSSASDALAVALKDAGLSKSKVMLVETDVDRTSIEVEFVKKSNKAKYEYEIAKGSGVILEKSVDYAYKHNASKAKIGKKAALKKVAKVSHIKYSVVKRAKCTYKYKKNEGKYKVTFRYKGYKYEYELLAPTGKIIEWEKERVSR